MATAVACFLRRACLLALGMALVTPRLHAQEPEGAAGARVVPTTQVVITGYGTAGYAYRTQADNVNAFTASINPIFLFQFQDRILFESELEFALQEGITETDLEYAQLDIILTDNISIVGGKFLLPFGVFGDRLHPTWVNKFPTAPPLYGHHVSAFGAEPLFSILSDVGFMGRGVVVVGRANVALNAYITQGAAPEEGHDEMPGGDEEIPELGFPASSSDNNTNKMVGARLDLALPPWAEVNFSFFNGEYDDNNILDLTGWNVAGELHARGLEIRGEYMQRRQQIEEVDAFPIQVRHGFYAQAAYRFGPWEPVFRWTQLFDTKVDGEVQDEGAWQAGFGLDYWFSPSIAVMGGYEVNREDGPEIDNDRIVVHIAFGF